MFALFVLVGRLPVLEKSVIVSRSLESVGSSQGLLEENGNGDGGERRCPCRHLLLVTPLLSTGALLLLHPPRPPPRTNQALIPPVCLFLPNNLDIALLVNPLEAFGGLSGVRRAAKCSTESGREEENGEGEGFRADRLEDPVDEEVEHIDYAFEGLPFVRLSFVIVVFYHVRAQS